MSALQYGSMWLHLGRYCCANISCKSTFCSDILSYPFGTIFTCLRMTQKRIEGFIHSSCTLDSRPDLAFLNTSPWMYCFPRNSSDPRQRSEYLEEEKSLVKDLTRSHSTTATPRIQKPIWLHISAWHIFNCRRCLSSSTTWGNQQELTRYQRTFRRRPWANA
jgi:hypothetical protein